VLHGAGSFATSFVASVVEAIEMVTIVVGVGSIRGWRSTLMGAASGFVVLVAVGGGLGTALTALPIDVLRLVIGALLLVFGLQWLRKAVRRVARKGLAGDEEEQPELGEDGETRFGLDWTAFVLAFKGVLLEGLEIAFIVVSFGTAANQISLAAIGGGSALVLVGAAGAVFHGALGRIPRSVLILVVGLLLSTFGTFWSAEGIGVDWPHGDLSLLFLLGLYVLAGTAFVLGERRLVGVAATRPAT
jgi:uncharacterized membrane protein